MTVIIPLQEDYILTSEIPTSCTSIAAGTEPALGKVKCIDDFGHYGTHHSDPIEVLGEDVVFAWDDQIVISGTVRGEEPGVYPECTCGWKLEEKTMLVSKVAINAMGHAKATGHILRPHVMPKAASV
jgi:hypothetical protein